MNREWDFRRWAAVPALGIVVGLLPPTGAGAVQTQPAGDITPAPYIRVLVDGQPVSFDVPPVVTAGRVLVPLRGVFNRLGAVVVWDPEIQRVLAARTNTSITLRIGDTLAHINGQPTLMDVPAVLVEGRTMVPLRFISQALGCQVSWDAASSTVQIASQSGVLPSQPHPPAAQPTAPPAIRPDPGPGSTSSAAARTPTITNPMDGATIRPPFTVAGKARPGSHVKVTADYDGSMVSRELTGSLGTYTVTADRDGEWSVKFTDELPAHGLNVTITAVEVDGEGRALAPAATVSATSR